MPVTISSLVKKVATLNIIIFTLLGGYLTLLAIFIVVMSINDKQLQMICPGLLMFGISAPCWVTVFKNIRRHRDPGRNGSIQRLAKAGLGTADEIIRNVDGELEHDLQYTDKKAIFITTHWIVSRTTINFNIRPISDLVWVYKEIVRTNLGMKHYSFNLVFNDRKKAQTNAPEKEVDALIAFILQSSPNVLVGYDEKNYVKYKK
jgi:hypothetical protein